MSRERILSQSKALYVTKTGVLDGIQGTEATQLQRIDNLSFEVDIAGARQDVNVFGSRARIQTLVNSELAPTCSFGYLLTDGENEHHLGFEIKSSMTGDFEGNIQGISGFLSEHPDFRERNIFIVTVGEGNDAFESKSWDDRTEHDVVGLGNSFINNYDVNLSVGEIPRAEVSFECGNIAFYTGRSDGLTNPSINPALGTQADEGEVTLPIASTGNSDVDVLRAGQIQLDLQDSNGLGIGGVNLSTIHPQSVSISVPLSRESQEEIGKDLPSSRPLVTPLDVTFSVNARMADIAEGQTAGLLTGCNGQVERNISVKLFDRCDPTVLRLGYLLKKAVLDNASWSTDLNGSETVDLQFSAQIAGASSSEVGFFLTGSYDPDTKGSPLDPTLVDIV